MKNILFLISIVFITSCSERREPREMRTVHTEGNRITTAKTKKELIEKGYEIFDYIDQETGNTILMQKYFIAFLKNGENRSQTKTVSDSLQKLHMEHLQRMFDKGYADISGPFDADGDIRGITIYNVPTLEIADSLANLDPMVNAGRLKVEVHPWLAAKGSTLR